MSSVLAAVCLALAGEPGYYMDELYFRAAAGHLAWGYIDQPPLVPLLAKAQIALFGDTLTAIRVVPTLLAGIAVFVSGLIARELGGGTRTQVLAACASAVSLGTLSAAHVLHPTSIDHLAWLTICWLAVRLVRTGDGRLWAAVGAAAGVGMLAKYLVVLLIAVLVGGLALAGPRRVLLDRRVLAGLGAGLVLALPGLVWQASHGWPQFAMAESVSDRPGVDSAIGMMVGQVLMIGPFLVPVWVAGLIGLFRRSQWRPYRFLGVAYLLATVLLVLVGGQARYVAGLLTVLLAAGCVVAVDWAGTAVRRAWLGLAVAANAVFAAVLVLPVLPTAWYAENPVLAAFSEPQLGQVGWPELAAQIAAVHRSLPPQDRTRAVVYGGNYAEAGAVARYGPALGLPPAYSGHNSYADFGRPADDKTVVIAFGVDRMSFSRLFRSCVEQGRLSFALPHLDQGKEILVCRDPLEPWSLTWPRLRWTGTF